MQDALKPTLKANPKAVSEQRKEPAQRVARGLADPRIRLPVQPGKNAARASHRSLDMPSTARPPLLLLAALASSPAVVSPSPSGGGCPPRGGDLYACPPCGDYVSDCRSCGGHAFPDRGTMECVDRRLFGLGGGGGDDSGGGGGGRSYLWRDAAGTAVWFLAAGVATACGVGGGGVYVPLGIILLVRLYPT